MPVYAYKALDASGKNKKGLVDAQGPRAAREKLRAEGLYPLELSQAEKRADLTGWFRNTLLRFRRPRSSHGDLTAMTRQLAALLNAGLPLVEALSAIQDQIEDDAFRRTVALIRDDIGSGESFSSAVGSRPDIFPIEYVQMAKAGEMAGALDQVLTRTAEGMERSRARRADVLGALTYPAFMTLVGAGVLIFLFIHIIPTLTGLFEGLDAALPWPTRLLLGASSFLQSAWWILLAVMAATGLWFWKKLKNEDYYRRVEIFSFKAPVIGPLIKKIRLSRALRALSIMIGGGVPVTTALVTAGNGMGRSIYGRALLDAAEAVGRGRTLTDGLKGGLFPSVVLSMVSVGEAGGILDRMVDNAALIYENETERALNTATRLIEPIVILVMGLIIGFVVMAVLIPIFDLSTMVG